MKRKPILYSSSNKLYYICTIYIMCMFVKMGWGALALPIAGSLHRVMSFFSFHFRASLALSSGFIKPFSVSLLAYIYYQNNKYSSERSLFLFFNFDM